MATVRVLKMQRAPARPAARSNVGLHLPSGDHLLPTDRPRDWWDQHGRKGHRDVVCLDCHTDGVQDAWLIYAEGEIQRAHLRHPRRSGLGLPVHEGETWWHTAAKTRLAAWAETLPNVTEVHLEHLVPEAGDHGRRPDVLVKVDGRWVTLEIQQSALRANVWARRTGDARDCGMTPVWLFAPHNHPLLEESAQMHAGSCLIFDLEYDEVGLLVRRGRAPTGRWWDDPTKDLTVYVDRAARAGDRPDQIHFGLLSECSLDADKGMVLGQGVAPSEDVRALEAEAAEKRTAEQRMKAYQDRQKQIERERQATRPPDEYIPAPGYKPCVICGQHMSTDYYGPEQDRHDPFYGCGAYR